MGATLAYYADGRVHTAQASTERRFDRAYTYDHAGRMLTAVSGFEAGMGSTEFGPYRQSFAYDAFSNMTLRTGRLWSGIEDAYATTYVNDRNQAWSYNEAGLPNAQETLTSSYSSAGLRQDTVSPNRQIGTQVVNLTLDQRYDGDGQLTKTTSSFGSITTYNIRSSVLGGQVISDVTSSGARKVGYVYANGQLIARQTQFSGVQWEHRDPMNTRARLTSSTGANLGGAEYDPTHSSVGLEDPGPGGDGTFGDLLYPRSGDATDLSGGCTVDFMVVPCSLAMSVANMEAGVATDPYAAPSLRWNENLKDGRGAFEVFHAKADGFVGYGEIGTLYRGFGVFRTRPVLGRPGGKHSSGSRFANTDLGEDGEPEPQQTTSQKSGCDQLVDYLMEAVNSFGASVTQRALGAKLALAARGTLAQQATDGKLPWDGFKENLVAGGQNEWAWVHIAGMAGSVLAGNTDRIAQQFREDRGQLKVGQDFKAAGRTTIDYGGRDDYPLDKFIAEKQAEIDDDHAGVAAGGILSRKINEKLDFTLAKVQITNLLCK